MILVSLFSIFLFMSCTNESPSDLEFSREDQANSRSTDENKSEMGPKEAIVFKTLYDRVLEPYGCIHCHYWAHDEKLLKKVTILPGEPFSSELYLKVENGSMPREGSSLSKDDLEIVEQYIEQLL